MATFSNEQIREYIANVQASGGTNAQIAQAMDQFNVSPTQVAAAINAPVAAVQSAYDVARSTGTYATPAAPAAAPATGMMTGAPTPAASATTPAAPAAPTRAFAVDFVTNFLKENPKLTDQQIADLMDKYDVAPDVVSNATKLSLSDVQKRYDAVRSNKGEFSNYVPQRPTFDTVFTNWNEEHKRVFGTYLNLGRTTEADVTAQVKELNETLAKQQADWDKTYGNTATAQKLKTEPPPTWNNVYATWAEQYKKVFNTDVLDRPWNSDPDAIRQKQELDNAYVSALNAYNAKNGTNLRPDPAVLGENVQPNAIFKVETKKPSVLASVAPFALMLVPGMQGVAASIGAALGATGAAATAIGTGIITGSATGLITGDAKKALITGITAGAGNFVATSGIAGNLLNSVGLGDVATALKIPTTAGVADAAFYAADAAQLAAQGLSPAAITQNLTAAGLGPGVAANVAQLAAQGASTSQLQSALTSTPGGMFSANVSDAQFIGADAAQLAAQGLNNKAIEQNLVKAGVDPFIAADAAQLAVQGFNASTISQNLTQSGANIPGGMFTGTPTTPTTAAPPTPPKPPTTPAAPPTTPGTPTTPGLPSVPGLPAVPSLLSNLFKDVTIKDLLNAGIDYASASKIASDLEAQAGRIQSQAVAAGQAAQVPFTPYTVTTGMGTTTIGPTGATMAATPAYQQLQQTALQQAQAAAGAINPAQAAQTLFQQAEALAAPGRVREQEALLGGLRQRGLLGFGQNLPTTGGAIRTVNPLMESLLSAQETARASSALQAQQQGTAEALRQQQLSSGLQSQAQNVDIQQLNQLLRAQGLSQDQINLALKNAEARRLSTMGGLQYSTPLLLDAATVRSGQTGAAATQARNLVGTIFSSAVPSLFASSAANSGFGTGNLFGNQDYGQYFGPQ
jgi:hypothetical protein